MAKTTTGSRSEIHSQPKRRSRTVKEVLRLRSRGQPQDKLAKGYRAMAEENRETAERHLPAFLPVAAILGMGYYTYGK